MYQNKQYFEEKNILLIKKVGVLFLAEELIRLGAMPLHTFLLTFQNLPGKSIIAFSFNQDNFYSIIIASTILLIGAVMRQAQLLQAEQSLTI
jgi:hypothetical protein